MDPDEFWSQRSIDFVKLAIAEAKELMMASFFHLGSMKEVVLVRTAVELLSLNLLWTIAFLNIKPL